MSSFFEYISRAFVNIESYISICIDRSQMAHAYSIKFITTSVEFSSLYNADNLCISEKSGFHNSYREVFDTTAILSVIRKHEKSILFRLTWVQGFRKWS